MLAKGPLRVAICRSSSTNKKGLMRTLKNLTQYQASGRSDVWLVTAESLFYHAENNRIVISDNKVLPCSVLKIMARTPNHSEFIPIKFSEDAEDGYYYPTRNKIHHLPE